MGIIRRLREWREGPGGTLEGPALHSENATIERFPRNALLTSDTLITDLGYLYPVDTGGSAVTITLASAMVSDGAEVIVKDEGGAAATNAITVATEGSETIDGATSQSIGSDYGSLVLYSDGTNWFVKGSTAGGGTL